MYATPNGQHIVNTFDLFKDYAVLTIQNVAASNCWYVKWPKPAVSSIFRQNLLLSLDFLQNNSTDRLWEKCLEQYDQYDVR